MRSMTAYAQILFDAPQVQIHWQARSLNHRHLELSFKMPESYQHLEIPLRNLAKKVISRGKIDCSFRYEWKQEKHAEFHLVSQDMLRHLHDLSQQVIHFLPQAEHLSVAEVLKWPGVYQGDRQEDISSVIVEAFEKMLDELVVVREREGLVLRECVLSRVERLESLKNKISQRAPEIQQALKRKLQEKLAVLEQQLDVARFEQEYIYLAQKIDISEELDRITAHLAEVKRVVSQEEVVGKKLDFLMQELHREVNTLCAKGSDTSLIQDGIECKLLVEELREQIQNIE